MTMKMKTKTKTMMMMEMKMKLCLCCFIGFVLFAEPLSETSQNANARIVALHTAKARHSEGVGDGDERAGGGAGGIASARCSRASSCHSRWSSGWPSAP